MSSHTRFSDASIPAFYKGHVFPGRTVARWAVLLDKLGVAYHLTAAATERSRDFEPEFFLPSLEVYVKIKSTALTDSDCNMLMAFARKQQRPVYAFFGRLEEQAGYDGGDNLPSDSGQVFHPDGGWDNQQWWCECSMCDAVGIAWNGCGDRVNCACRKSGEKTGDRGHSACTPRIQAAFKAAKRFRFPSYCP